MSSTFVAFAVASLTLALLISGLSTNTASADAVQLWSEIGTTGKDLGQTEAAVDTMDQWGTDDNWDRYIEFLPDYSTNSHRSVFEMTPEPGPGNDMTVSLNYRGPSGDWSRWELLMIDWADPNEPWVTVWDNEDMPSWTWTGHEFTIPNIDRYLNAAGNAIVIWRSTEAIDATQFDYLSLRRSGTPTGEPPVPPGPDIRLPPFGGDFDYQIGQTHTPAANVDMVSRDWFADWPEPGLYNICYVNAFQTQPDDAGDRIDTRFNWPNGTVTPLEDGYWNEFVINLTTPALRQLAADHVYRMIDGCANKGFDAVEFDNLDVWTRIPKMDEGRQMTEYWFYQAETEDYAKLLVDYTHRQGMAAAQKNTTDLFDNGGHQRIGFDFVIAESCAKYSECWTFAENYDDRVIAIEYEYGYFNSACGTYGNRFPVVLEDEDVVAINAPSSFC